MQTVVVSVAPKDPKISARRKEVQHLLASAGLKTTLCKGVEALYKLEGELAPSQAQKIADELLCDPVVETCSTSEKTSVPGGLYADVWFKRGVMDPAGESVMKAIRDLGISTVRHASSGTRYIFEGSGDILQFASRALLNPLIQECRITGK